MIRESPPSLVSLFASVARAQPHHPAVCAGGHAVSYGALDRSSDAVAVALGDLLGSGESPVGILLGNGFASVAASLGALKAGRPFVPLDPGLPPERGACILEDSTAAALVTDAAGRGACEAWGAGRLPLLEWERIQTPAPAGLAQEGEVPPDAPAWILYTSGSTGRPKGVVQTRRNAVHYAQTYRAAQRLTPDDRLSLVFSFSANFAQHQTFAALLSGAALHPFDVRREGFPAMARWLAEERITVLWCVPTAFRRLAESAQGIAFPDLRLVLLGGEPVLRTDWEAYTRLCTDECVFVCRFGTSETGTIRWLFADKRTRIEKPVVPVGHPAPDYDVVILDEEGHDVAPGRIGEIVARSRYLSPGYWRRPDLTAKAFRDDPREEGERLFFTGDIGRLEEDGCLLHLGRKDFQVKIRGHRVELGEVEHALLACPGVREAVAMGRADAAGQPRLVAWLVPAPEGRPTVTALRRRLAESLPEYMIPSAFVFLDALPLAPNGKVHRGALPDPPPTRPPLDTPFAAPADPLEQALAGIWQEVLGIEGIGRDDDFLELGGHSIAAARIRARIAEALGIDLAPRDLLEGATIRRMAAAIGRASGA